MSSWEMQEAQIWCMQKWKVLKNCFDRDITLKFVKIVAKLRNSAPMYNSIKELPIWFSKLNCKYYEFTMQCGSYTLLPRGWNVITKVNEKKWFCKTFIEFFVATTWWRTILTWHADGGHSLLILWHFCSFCY